jgi:hypothetical protein
MASMLTTASDGAWTVEDLAALPDDGLRYELVDGALLVTPPPGPRHQIAAYQLAKVLEAALPAHLRLLPGPVAVRTSAHRELQPDLSVAPASSVGPARLEGAPPALVVEVLSHSTPLDRLGAQAGAVRGDGRRVVLGAGPSGPVAACLGPHRRAVRRGSRRLRCAALPRRATVPGPGGTDRTRADGRLTISRSPAPRPRR